MLCNNEQGVQYINLFVSCTIFSCARYLVHHQSNTCIHVGFEFTINISDYEDITFLIHRSANSETTFDMKITCLINHPVVSPSLQHTHTHTTANSETTFYIKIMCLINHLLPVVNPSLQTHTYTHTHTHKGTLFFVVNIYEF